MRSEGLCNRIYFSAISGFGSRILGPFWGPLKGGHFTPFRGGSEKGSKFGVWQYGFGWYGVKACATEFIFSNIKGFVSLIWWVFRGPLGRGGSKGTFFGGSKNDHFLRQQKSY